MILHMNFFLRKMILLAQQVYGSGVKLLSSCSTYDRIRENNIVCKLLRNEACLLMDLLFMRLDDETSILEMLIVRDVEAGVKVGLTHQAGK